MCAVTHERLAASAKEGRQRQRVARRRATLLAGVVTIVLGGIGVAVMTLRAQVSADNAAVASPVASASPDLGSLPPNRVIAAAGPVDLNLPVDRSFAKFTLFHPINDLAGVAITPDKSWKHTIWPEDGIGPRTAALDIAAPAGTVVYSPVSGTISGVSDLVVTGRTIGYSVDISPDAASDVVVRVRYIDPVPVDRQATEICGAAGVDKPRVGEIVTAGVTCLGQVHDVRDIVDIARPLIAKYTSDGGNHVHVEVVRVGS